MQVLKKHEGVCGIYVIRNTVNNKVYVGKSINIRQRMYNHIGGLRAKDLKRENSHFIHSWWKYGKDSFDYFIVEVINFNTENLEELMSEKELFWMKHYDSLNPTKGYNKREDSSTGLIVSKETRKKLSIATRKRYECENERRKTSLKSSKFWKENSEIKKQMSEKVSKALTVYKIHQYSKDGSTLIKVWERVKDIINENPNYKTHNIYSVCSGAKPSIYGYKWVKVKQDEIVQADENQ